MLWYIIAAKIPSMDFIKDMWRTLLSPVEDEACPEDLASTCITSRSSNRVLSTIYSKGSSRNSSRSSSRNSSISYSRSSNRSFSSNSSRAYSMTSSTPTSVEGQLISWPVCVRVIEDASRAHITGFNFLVGNFILMPSQVAHRLKLWLTTA